MTANVSDSAPDAVSGSAPKPAPVPVPEPGTDAIDRSRTVAVVGTGTMGQGIAQVALVAGHRVRLYDSAPGRAGEAVTALAARLDRLVEKGRMDRAERDGAVARLHAAAELTELADAALVVEAIVEHLPVKQQLFGELEKIVGDDTLLATNTSSSPSPRSREACGCPAGSSGCTSSTRPRCSPSSRSSAASPPTNPPPRARTRPRRAGARRRCAAPTPPGSSSTG